MADPKRRYSREETALILRRATETERRPGELESGLTLEEIEAAARDAGIDPAAVRRAAALAPGPASGPGSGLAGAPTAPEIRARFDGTLAGGASDFQAAVERIIDRRGEVAAETGALVWHEDHGFGRTTISARQEGGAVVVAAEADRRGHLLALVLVLATLIALLLQPLGGFAGLAALGGPLAAVLVPLIALALATRVLWPMVEQPVTRRLERAVLEVGALVRSPAPPDALPAPLPPAE